jgi:aspartyl/asparaginyl beta-hydroxylase (cupin superfamily)
MILPVTDSRMLEGKADRAASEGDVAAARSLLEQAVEADSGSMALWMKLSAMRKASGDLEGALAAINRALELSEFDFSALLSRAAILDNLGDPNAGQAYRFALAQIQPGQAIPPEWQSVVAHARKRSSDYSKAIERYLADNLPEDLSPAERSRADRFISNRSRDTRHYHQGPSEFHFPGMPEFEFHDRALFPGIAVLEQATDAIRAEFEALIAAEAAEMVPYVQFPETVPLRQWKELNNNPKWTAIHLLQNGWPVEANARHCPRTIEAVSAMDQPQVPGASPVAMFSLLAPRTHIPPHKGTTNTRLVCHLPLIVPPNCGFRVGASTREWRVGEAFVFDDTIEHEAWNDSDELRVILILDVWPPTLGPGDRRAVATVIGATNANFVASRRREADPTAPSHNGDT